MSVAVPSEMEGAPGWQELQNLEEVLVKRKLDQQAELERVDGLRKASVYR